MNPEDMLDPTLEQRLAFVLEIDKLKRIVRRTRLLDNSRYENDAEHSWHLAVMAMVLSAYSDDPGLDVGRVIRMVLVHDLVEIDAGDTYLYDEQAKKDKARREALAADRVFGLLPAAQAAEVRGLWEEFEARKTPEARFAAALDRLEPLLQNYHTQGFAWRAHGIHSGQVLAANQHMQNGSRTLWRYAERLIRRAVEEGMLAREPDGSSPHAPSK